MLVHVFIYAVFKLCKCYGLVYRYIFCSILVSSVFKDGFAVMGFNNGFTVSNRNDVGRVIIIIIPDELQPRVPVLISVLNQPGKY